MRPAYLADAAAQAVIRFRLPATGGGTEAFQGRIIAIERVQHAARTTAYAFRLDTYDRTFTCSATLHIDIEETR
jgi:hypothetical protein